MKYLVGHENGESPEQAAVYAVKGDKAVNLTAHIRAIETDLLGLILDDRLATIVMALLDSAPLVSLNSITPLLPVARPSKIICLGLNYVDHIKEGGYEVPDYPALFMRGQNSMMAAGAPMIRPTCSEQLDYEAELMVIIGKGGKHISEADALSHVFGYTIFNDGSVRNYQRKTHQWTPGKNFDSTGAVGPFVVTPDELPSGAQGLKIEARVGDEVLQSANTSEMLWSVEKTIATISEYATLEPGDMIAMGLLFRINKTRFLWICVCFQHFFLA